MVVKMAENRLVGSLSNENKTCIISFVLTLPFMSLSTDEKPLGVGQSDRDHHPSACLELIDQRMRNEVGRRCNDHLVEGRVLRPTESNRSRREPRRWYSLLV